MPCSKRSEDYIFKISYCVVWNVKYSQFGSSTWSAVEPDGQVMQIFRFLFLCPRLINASFLSIDSRAISFSRVSKILFLRYVFTCFKREKLSAEAEVIRIVKTSVNNRSTWAVINTCFNNPYYFCLRGKFFSIKARKEICKE